MQKTPAKKNISRDRALDSRPVKLELVAQQETEEGGLRLTAELERPRWQRWLGGSPKGRRTFELDAFGNEVYTACDGINSVEDIITGFADTHNLSLPEAEISVTRFLRMLVQRGLVAIEMDREYKGNSDE